MSDRIPSFAGGWRLETVHYGNGRADGRCRLGATDGAVFAVARG